MSTYFGLNVLRLNALTAKEMVKGKAIVGLADTLANTDMPREHVTNPQLIRTQCHIRRGRETKLDAPNS